MQPVNMFKMHYSKPIYQNKVQRQNSQIFNSTPSFKAIDDDKNIIRREIDDPNILIKFFSKIGIIKPQKVKIEVKPQIDRDLVNDEEFEILTEAFKDSGKIMKIEKIDVGGEIFYGKITLENGFVAILPSKENILPKDKLKEKIINNAHQKLSLEKSAVSAMETLYEVDFEDMTKETVQPQTPYVLEQSELKTNPDDKDNYLESRKNLKRKDIAALFRFGEHSLTNGKRSQTTNLIVWHINRNISKDAKTSDIRVIKNENNEKFVFYDEKTNLSTIFDSKGNPLAQVAFNSHFDYGEQPIPTDYKLYSLFDKKSDTYRSFVE